MVEVGDFKDLVYVYWTWQLHLFYFGILGQKHNLTVAFSPPDKLYRATVSVFACVLLLPRLTC